MVILLNEVFRPHNWRMNMENLECATEVATHRPNGALMTSFERIADAMVKGLTFECGDILANRGFLRIKDTWVLACSKERKNEFFLRLPKDIDLRQLRLLDEVIGNIYIEDDDNPVPSKYEDMHIYKHGGKGIMLSVGHVSGDEFKHLLKWEMEWGVGYKVTWDSAGFHIMKLSETVPPCK